MPTAATVKSSRLKPYSQAAVLSEYSTLDNMKIIIFLFFKIF